MFSSPASPGHKPPQSLRLIGAEDAARLAMCNPDDAETAANDETGHRALGIRRRLADYWPGGAVILVGISLTWLIG